MTVTAFVVVAAMVGCSSSSGPRPSASTHPESTEPTANSSRAVIAEPPAGEKVLGQLENQRGTQQIGPVQSGSGRIAVYVTCVGTGVLQIDIPGVGSFPNKCDPTGSDPDIANTFDVRYVDSVTVTGTADDSLLWGLTVTVPHD